MVCLLFHFRSPLMPKRKYPRLPYDPDAPTNLHPSAFYEHLDNRAANRRNTKRLLSQLAREIDEVRAEREKAE